MNVTWIIGNGFDRTIGLDTGYRAFLDNEYLRSDYTGEHRDELVKRVDRDKMRDDRDHWADLEALLGYASTLYEDNEELFHATFQEMQISFVEYVHKQELRLPETLPESAVDEFRATVCRFFDRFAPVDKMRFPLSEGVADHFSHRFISLNYTTVFDRFLASVKDKYSPLYAHRTGSTTFQETTSDVFHLHGITDGGKGSEIVFGVADNSQIASEPMSSDPVFCELWVKWRKNESIHGNLNTRRMQNLIGDSNVICIYGCSLGDSDKYIWREVGDRVRTNNGAFLVMFVHGMPNRADQNARLYQQKREEALRRFANAADIDDEELKSIRGRIILVPSSDYFLCNVELS